jgi:serine/threonine protein kinase
MPDEAPPPRDTIGAAPGVPAPVSAAVRDDVQIPDYHFIKRIGAGAYGEVWLAQSLTGSLRAVKIVWREDFELTKTFYREFEGIQQFEPLSRGHPGMVQILHVGWNEERGYYYCVMELADDAVEGPHITDLQAYVPRTLSSDLKQHGRLDLHFCQEAGAYIADALHYLHQHGLTHRDVKPSNIFYCGGVCKLADIGLVAVSGERSFVGTEGFVPPEGPGTPQADIYSLGKVIYEMSSGKDRMEFPEVPEELDAAEWPRWKNLNRVICQACAPDLDERFATGEAMADALRSVNEYAPVTFVQRVSRMVSRAALFVMFTCMAGAAWAAWQHQQSWTYQVPLPQKPPPPSRLPEPNRPWQSSVGTWFSFRKDRHIADQPVDFAAFNRFLEATMRSFDGEVVPLEMADKKTLHVVIVDAEDAIDFCEWMTENDRRTQRLTEAQEYAWRPYRSPALKPTRPKSVAMLCEIVPVFYGRLMVQSTPAPAQVYRGEELLGATPLSLPKMEAGPLEIEVRYPGYKPETLKTTVKIGQTASLTAKLKNINAVIDGKAWTNTLSLRLVPLGKILLGATEVTRRAYREFASARKLPVLSEQALDNEAALDQPITHVTRSEAQAFCDWLTEREQAREMIDGNHRYRLPSDDEWSMAANLPREAGDSPAARHLVVGGIYPWGFTWPPIPQPGNLLDPAAAAKLGGQAKGIEGYQDNFEGIAPVGKFRADWRGVQDLAGNVWEWVSDDFGGEEADKQSLGVCRGGAWDTSSRAELTASYRHPIRSDAREANVGFRVVLSDGRAARLLDE